MAADYDVMRKHCLDQMGDSLARFEAAEATFSRITATARAMYPHNPRRADELLAANETRQLAGADATYYSARIQAYAAAYGVYDREATRG